MLFEILLFLHVCQGKLDIQGGIYHLETGRVEFLGRAPNQAELLASDLALPASVKGLPVRTTTDGPMPPKEALQILKDGNKRFVTGEALSGNVTNGMRRALVKEGQAPLAAIIGCADSRAPLETVFDAMPGDIFVLRNAGNTCTHAEGSMVGSLEFCVGALGTKILGWHWDALGGRYRKFGEVEILFRTCAFPGWSWSSDIQPVEPLRVQRPHTCRPSPATSPRLWGG